MLYIALCTRHLQQPNVAAFVENRSKMRKETEQTHYAQDFFFASFDPQLTLFQKISTFFLFSTGKKIFRLIYNKSKRGKIGLGTAYSILFNEIFKLTSKLMTQLGNDSFLLTNLGDQSVRFACISLSKGFVPPKEHMLRMLLHLPGFPQICGV